MSMLARSAPASGPYEAVGENRTASCLASVLCAFRVPLHGSVGRYSAGKQDGDTKQATCIDITVEITTHRDNSIAKSLVQDREIPGPAVPLSQVPGRARRRMYSLYTAPKKAFSHFQ